MIEYVINYVDLTNDEDYEDFTGRIDIEKASKQLFTNDELDRLESYFESLPVSITANETGLSLWLFDKDHTDEIMETVKAELEKQGRLKMNSLIFDYLMMIDSLAYILFTFWGNIKRRKMTIKEWQIMKVWGVINAIMVIVFIVVSIP